MFSKRFHFNSRVYEMMIKEGETNVNFLNKQVNNTFSVAAFKSEYVVNISFNELVADLTSYFESLYTKVSQEFGRDIAYDPDKLKHLLMYPLMLNNLDEKMGMVYYAGLMEEIVKRKTDEPYPCKADATPEEKEAAHAAWVAPRTTLVPFVLAAPAASSMMFDIAISHVPDGAISFYTAEQERPQPEDLEIDMIPSEAPEFDSAEVVKVSVARTFALDSSHNPEIDPAPYVGKGCFESEEELRKYAQWAMTIPM